MLNSLTGHTSQGNKVEMMLEFRFLLTSVSVLMRFFLNTITSYTLLFLLCPSCQPMKKGQAGQKTVLWLKVASL